MHLIKLNATESTNTFLKDYCSSNDAENFTVVWAMNQTKGRGQMNAVWRSEGGKNLTFSVLVKLNDFPLKYQFYISKAISVAIYSVLVKILPNNICIKWPNDILADNHKIAGILIENKIKKAMVADSIIGIGLNVNQEIFPELSNAISMKNLSKSSFDLESILYQLVEAIKKNIELVQSGFFETLDKSYLKNLYKFQKPSMFQENESFPFLAKIVGVSVNGKLQVELEDGTIREFDLKEIKFLQT